VSLDPVRSNQEKSLADSAILRGRVFDSFQKLDPRTMVKNPVMFVVEVGAVLTTIQLAWNALHPRWTVWFGLQITLWLWFHGSFANFAESHGRGAWKGASRHAAQIPSRNASPSLAAVTAV